MSVVNVLTPNGRRQNVKVQPNLVLIKVNIIARFNLLPAKIKTN